VGEPDLSLRDLLDNLEGRVDRRPAHIERLFAQHDPKYQVARREDGSVNMHAIKGLAWRQNGSTAEGGIVVNFTRPFIKDLNALPHPLHDLLPWQKYRMPLINGPFTFIVTSRGCPAGCTYCIKHVSYQYSVRTREPEHIMEELWQLKKMGLNSVHMYADLFTVNRDQVMGLCKLMIEENINLKWTCNSRVDYVDEEMLQMMAKAGNWLISWGIESGNEQILRHARKGAYPDKAERALVWARQAGIKNWGYFIIGLPGETEATIRDTIDFSKKLPLDIALFHVAAPYPGTPFFFEVVENNWFRPGTRWEQVDMDKGTVLDYPNLPAERLLYWQKRAFREWALRPGPMLTYLKMLFSDASTFKTALNVGLQHLSWAGTDSGAPVTS
ncbi:MAG TPA: radical SAM protein, partial [Candidatus Binatia bacterium]|nr:radical SAM protein [Candidatus Binatia bacterium]